MKQTLTILAALLLTGTAGAGDVYVTRDAQGTPVYTDTPQSIPAEKVRISSASSDPSTVEARYAEQMKKYAQDDKAYAKSSARQANAEKVQQQTAEDRAKLCAEARQRYESYMSAQRLYAKGPNDERTYLSDTELDAARADAKKVMVELCSEQ